MTDALLDQARSSTRQHARTFALACRLLPRSVRDDVYRLYFVFRTLDDLVDDGHPAACGRVTALERWAAGEAARSPETAVLAEIDARSPLPRSALSDFAAGMRMDLDSHPVRSEADLSRYCYQVAGTVGLVMASLLGSDAAAGNAAIALGSAMQLTNILRDVDEDERAGRRYLPDSAGPLAPDHRTEQLEPFIARADALYAEGLQGVHRLERGRWAIRCAALMYREILREIERDNRAAIVRRAHVGPWRKAWIVLRSAPGSAWARSRGPFRCAGSHSVVSSDSG